MCFWLKDDNGVATCVEAPVQLLSASSPAFEIPDYDWSSGKYSTWTESVWLETGIKMFIQVSNLACWFLILYLKLLPVKSKFSAASVNSMTSLWKSKLHQIHSNLFSFDRVTAKKK